MTSYVPEDLILQARRLRKEKGYTYQYIIDRAGETENFTNMTTVRRFFTADLRVHRFQFQTVQGILDVVFDGSEAETVQALRVEVDELRRQLEEERLRHAEETRILKEETRGRVEFIKAGVMELWGQIEVKDRLISERDALVVELFKKLLGM